MKNRITFRLVKYFSIVIIVFSIIVGLIFLKVFKRQIIETHKTDLINKADEISAELSELKALGEEGVCIEDCVYGLRHDKYDSYLYYISDIASTHVWIINDEREIIARGRQEMTPEQYNKLPPNAEEIISGALNGKKVLKTGVGKDDKVPTVTIGQPIIDDNGKIIGMVLLHNHIYEMKQAEINSLKALILSMGIGIILISVLAVYFSIKFTNPLKKMKDVSLILAEGNYNIKTEIKEKDEIGELAHSLDILADKLNDASKESERLEKMRQEFISNISHELRTPITVMRGSLEALSNGIIKNEDKVNDYYKEMLAESIFLQTLVNDLLELTKLQSVDFKIDSAELNFCDVAEDVIRSVRRMAEGKNILINYASDVKVLRINGDYVRLRQMLIIILDNAIKFSKEGQDIEVKLDNSKISITNSGNPIPEKDIPFIFNRFFKSSEEVNNNGSGLGLSICKEIVDRHKMSISVESNVKYTTFTIRFGKA